MEDLIVTIQKGEGKKKKITGDKPNYTRASPIYTINITTQHTKGLGGQQWQLKPKISSTMGC